ncbi:hypothetical protein Avbf_02923 [Armadillidium vulgare]|nr:hypothetical protein Avbf_02923 [Armadillidium vulgare]
MIVKSLRDLCFEITFRLTIRNAPKIANCKDVWFIVFDTWNYISLIPIHTTEFYYKILNKYAHWLSHDTKIGTYDDLRHFPTLTADEVFNMFITCQSPKLIFNYRMKRQRVIPKNILPLIDYPELSKYFDSILVELDLSGADFCCDDSLLIHLLPKCHSLQVLCLGNAGSDRVLAAAQSCPLRKLQLEERFPLNPKLPQDIVLKYILGYGNNVQNLNDILEICKLKSQALLDKTCIEECVEVRRQHINSLENFLKSCQPSWPKMKSLVFGNCRICREALMLCLLVLKNLEEISVHRIQSDEILNTCERVFNYFDLNYETSIKSLTLWAGWAGFRTNALKIAPSASNLSLIAYGYSNLSLKETVEKNATLTKINTLSFVGLRHAGPSVFQKSNHFLSCVQSLEISGVLLSTEELVNIFSCLPNLTKMQLDYSEFQNHTFSLDRTKYPKNVTLTHFSVETSYLEFEFLKALFTMARNIIYLCIRGKTRNFKLPFDHQNLFLTNPGLNLQYLELYPENKLNISGLISLSRHKSTPYKRQLVVPLSSLGKSEMKLLMNNGWYIIPDCSRC